MPWQPFHDGLTIGTQGSEGGIVLLEEEHPLGARIALERVDRRGYHAVTCGVYGLMLHTAFAGSEGEGRALYEAMRARLVPVLEAESDEVSSTLCRAFIEEF